MNKSIYPLNFTTSTKELKKIIAEHPNYPIVVLAGADAVCSDYHYTVCTDTTFHIGRILDYATPYTDGDDCICTDEDCFREKIEDCWADDERYCGLSDKEFDRLLELEVRKYDKYWKDVIFIYADN